jgi:branched-chain amino acid transport system ATP-binding protein
MEMLEAIDLHVYYGDSYVLQGLSLKVDKGRVVVVVGRNGVGKTTLIRSIIGFTPPRRGQVVFKGVNITRVPSYRIVQMGMKIVPQGRHIFPSLTVRENLEIASRKKGTQWTLDRVLETFPRLKDRILHRGGKLSGGEQQMLAMGRALMGNPDLLLMDEPTEGLAPLLVQELEELLHRLKGEGLSILLVEQNLAFALELADYSYVISKGRVVYESSPKEVWKNEEVKARYLGVETASTVSH